MSAHTPGPWIWGEDHTGLRGTGYDCEVLSYYDYEGMGLCGDRIDANARLIAAAPDMLDILTSIEAVILGGNQDDFDLMLSVNSPIRNALYKAIAKATGQ